MLAACLRMVVCWALIAFSALAISACCSLVASISRGGEARVVDGPGVYTVLLVGHDLGNYLADLFGDDADLMLAVGL